MKVFELIAALRELPQDMDVYFDGSEWTQPVRQASVASGAKRVFFPDEGSGDWVCLSDHDATPKRSAGQ
jgi:hypothetical protein